MKSYDLLDIVIKNIYGVDGDINKVCINNSVISLWKRTINAIRALSKKRSLDIFSLCVFKFGKGSSIFLE